jgi:hypothetical protein
MKCRNLPFEDDAASNKLKLSPMKRKETFFKGDSRNFTKQQ